MPCGLSVPAQETYPVLYVIDQWGEQTINRGAKTSGMKIRSWSRSSVGKKNFFICRFQIAILVHNTFFISLLRKNRMTQVLFFFKKTSERLNVAFRVLWATWYSAYKTSSKNVKTQYQHSSFIIGCLLQFLKHFRAVKPQNFLIPECKCLSIFSNVLSTL